MYSVFCAATSLTISAGDKVFRAGVGNDAGFMVEGGQMWEQKTITATRQADTEQLP